MLYRNESENTALFSGLRIRPVLQLAPTVRIERTLSSLTGRRNAIIATLECTGAVEDRTLGFLGADQMLSR